MELGPAGRFAWAKAHPVETFRNIDFLGAFTKGLGTGPSSGARDVIKGAYLTFPHLTRPYGSGGAGRCP